MVIHSGSTPTTGVDLHDPVISACESNWEAHKSDCSGFVRAVAAELGVSLHGLANELVTSMGSSAAWRDLGANATQAMSYANNGYLVIAGPYSAVARR